MEEEEVTEVEDMEEAMVMCETKRQLAFFLAMAKMDAPITAITTEADLKLLHYGCANNHDGDSVMIQSS